MNGISRSTSSPLSLVSVLLMLLAYTTNAPFSPFLTFAPNSCACLLGHPESSRIALLHRFGPQQQNVHAPIRYAVMAQGSGDATCRMFRLPWFHPRANALFQVCNDAFRDARINTWLPFYLVERFQLGMASAGFSATIYLQAASFTGILVGGTLSDRWQAVSPRGRILMQAAGILLAAPFLFLVGFTHSMPLFILGIVTFGFGRGVYDCNTMPVLSQFVRPELRSTGYGLLNMFSCLAGGVIAVSAGFFKSSLGLAGAFEMAAALMVVAGVLLLRTGNR